MTRTYPTAVSVTIDPGCKIDRREIVEFVELFYPGSSPGVILIDVVDRAGHDGRRGECATSPSGRVHEITLFWKSIAKSASLNQVIGGNITKSRDLRTTAFFVLAHEIRHAFQAELHWNREKFFVKRGYMSRPCEVDARRYVDENYQSICEYLNVPADPSSIGKSSGQPEAKRDPLDEIVELFAGSGSITDTELQFALADVGMNNPITQAEAAALLAEEGVSVV